MALTEDAEKFRRWSVCSPETARVVKEFEMRSVLSKVHYTGHNFHHHEHSESFQKKYLDHVRELTVVFKRLGDPFCSGR